MMDVSTHRKFGAFTNVSKLTRHFEHRLAKADRGEQLLGGAILDGGVQDDARSAARTQLVQRALEQLFADALATRGVGHQDVVQRTVRIEQRVPVARFEPRVSVTDDFFVEPGAQDQSFLVQQLFAEPPLVARLRILDEQEAAWRRKP